MYSYRNTVRHAVHYGSSRFNLKSLTPKTDIMAQSPDTVEKVSKIWKVVKQIIEIILAALGGLAAGATANAAGFTALLQ